MKGERVFVGLGKEAAGWWDRLTLAQQKAYLEKRPNSTKKITAKKKKLKSPVTIKASGKATKAPAPAPAPAPTLAPAPTPAPLPVAVAPTPPVKVSKLKKVAQVVARSVASSFQASAKAFKGALSKIQSGQPANLDTNEKKAYRAQMLKTCVGILATVAVASVFSAQVPFAYELANGFVEHRLSGNQELTHKGKKDAAKKDIGPVVIGSNLATSIPNQAITPLSPTPGATPAPAPAPGATPAPASETSDVLKPIKEKSDREEKEDYSAVNSEVEEFIKYLESDEVKMYVQTTPKRKSKESSTKKAPAGAKAKAGSTKPVAKKAIPAKKVINKKPTKTTTKAKA